MKKIGYIGIGLLMFIGLFLLDQIPSTILLLMKWSKVSAFATSTVVIAVILLVVFLFYIMAKKMGYFESKEKLWTKENVWLVVGMFFLQKIFTLAIMPFMTSDSTVNNDAIIEMLGGSSFLLMFFLLCVLAPVVEEILCRGFITNYFFRDKQNQPISKGREVMALVVSSSVFGLMHTPENIPSFLLYGSMGLCFGLAYMKSNRLEVSMTLHFINNALALLALLVTNAIL